MADVIKLSCPSCGGKLEITPDIDRFACGYCGTEQIVKRSGGIVSLSPVVDAIKKVEMGVDKTASELALVRLKQEVAELETERYHLEKNSPRPRSSIWSVLFYIMGAATIIGALTGGGEIGVWFFVLGIVFLLVGWSIQTSNKGAKAIWDRSTGKKLDEYDDRIANKQDEIARHQKLVSQ